MQVEVEVERKHITKEKITLELPYYFELDSGGDDYDAMHFGKIEANRTTTISRRYDYRSKQITVEIEVCSCKPRAMACYLTDERRSTEAAYEKAKRDAQEVLSGA